MNAARPGRPPKDAEKNARQDLLDAAIRSFAAEGFRKVSLADIAAEAGVSIGLIRHYFGSKDGLIEECNRIVADTLGRMFRRMLEAELPGDGAGFIDELQRQTRIEFEGRIYLLFYLKQLSLDQPEASAAVFREYFNLLQNELNRLEAQGFLRSDVNKVWLTFQLMFMQMGPVYLSEQIESILGIPAHSLDAIAQRGEENTRMLKLGVLARGDEQ